MKSEHEKSYWNNNIYWHNSCNNIESFVIPNREEKTEKVIQIYKCMKKG